MAKKQIPLLSGITDTRNRTLVIVLAVIILVSIVFALSQLSKGEEDPLSKQGSQASGVPRIQSVPGGKASEKYVELQRKENVEKAEQAIKAKTASIPTIIGAIQEAPEDLPTPIENVDSGLAENQDKTRGGRIQIGEAESSAFISAGPFKAEKQKESRRAEIEKRREEQAQRVEKLREEQRARQEKQVQERKAAQAQKEHDADVKRIKTSMMKYTENAYKDWAKYPGQTYKAGKWEKEEYKTRVQRMLEAAEDENGKGSNIAGVAPDAAGNPQAIVRQQRAASAKQQRIYIKAGTVLFGVLDTSVNTDEPGPILASIVHGKYKGGKLVGTFTHQKQQEKAVLSFDTMTLPTHPKSISVKVVAIDPDTARTALASDVDKHYLLRYGSLFASSFMEGYAKALNEQGTTTTVSPLTGATTQTKPELSGSEQFYVALGEVGKRWGQQMRPLFNMPYTVTIDQGTGIGLLFTGDADVTLEQ